MNIDSPDIKILEKVLDSLNESDKRDVLAVKEIVSQEMGLGLSAQWGATLFSLLVSKNIGDEARLKISEHLLTMADGAYRIHQLESSRVNLNTENFIQLVLSISQDPRSILIVIAYHLYLIRGWRQLSEDLQPVVLREIKTLYAPIAHRLGLYTIKTEMEELWLKHSDYKTFRGIADQLAAKKNERETFISDFIAPVKEKLQRAGVQFEIKGRPKSIYSIWTKMQAQKVGVDDIYDKFAIRIIIETDDRHREKELCWQVYSLVTEEYTPFPRRLRDWISHPKSSGYESLHATVKTDEGQWVEVQIRTRRMDEIAEKGCAAHWRYKDASSGGSSTVWLSQMREALENPEESGDSDRVVKEALYSSNIYVFTPDKEVKKLRQGASVLDLAFSIHTSVGFHCSGARVNNQFVSIKHTLKTGDIVEVITSKKQVPNEDWLSWVASPSIKAKIRRYIRELQHSHSTSGREIIRRKMRSLNLDMSEENLSKVADFFKISSVIDLYEAVGLQQIDLQKIKDAFVASAPAESTLPKKAVSKIASASSDDLIIEETEGMAYNIAQCCKPLPGDPIFGFITVNKGVSIHSQRCPNARDLYLNHSERIISARWNREEALFRGTYILEVAREGESILSDLSSLIGRYGELKLLNISFPHKKSEQSLVEITVLAPNRDILDELIENLKLIEGVSRVYHA